MKFVVGLATILATLFVLCYAGIIGVALAFLFFIGIFVVSVNRRLITGRR
jgi:hypothetical protein